MASEICKDLRGVGLRLRKDGFPISATIVERSADRMDQMEKLLVDLNNQKTGSESNDGQD